MFWGNSQGFLTVLFLAGIVKVLGSAPVAVLGEGGRAAVVPVDGAGERVPATPRVDLHRHAAREETLVKRLPGIKMDTHAVLLNALFSIHDSLCMVLEKKENLALLNLNSSAHAVRQCNDVTDTITYLSCSRSR